MPGRRFSEGLHQALEAKEKVQIQPGEPDAGLDHLPELISAFTIKLAGMTGTASTEAEEFADIYKLDVVEIPTNRPIARLDENDEVYRTVEEKIRRDHPGNHRKPPGEGTADTGGHHLDRKIGNSWLTCSSSAASS